MALADGLNLYELSFRDDIDINHTYSNNVYEILANFGIEAARNFLIMELNNMMNVSGSYIDPRHVILIVDFITYDGNLKPLTYVGVKEQPTGALAMASFERSFDALIPAAVFGKEEQLTSVSGSIFVGKKIPTGTGYNTNFMKVDAEMEEKYNNLLQEGVTISPTEFSQGLEMLDFGVPVNAIERPDITEIKPPVEKPDHQISTSLPGQSSFDLVAETPNVISGALQESLETIPDPICIPAPTTIDFIVESEIPALEPVTELIGVPEEEDPVENEERILSPDLGGVLPEVLEEPIKEEQEESDWIDLKQYM